MPPPNVTGELHMGHAAHRRGRGHPHPLAAHGRRLHPLAARRRPRGHRRPERGREGACQRRQVRRHDLGREKFLERTWEWMNRYRPQHPLPAPPPRRVLRLDARALHDGPRPRARRAHRLQAPLRQGPHLQGRAHHQLVPPLRDRPLRPRSGARGGAGQPLDHPLSPGSATTAPTDPITTPASPWPPPAPRRCWAIPPWPCTPTTSARSTSSARRCSCPS